MQIFNPDSEVMEFLSKVADFIIINLLCFLCSIPIFTIGAAFTAKYYVSMKIVRGEEPSATKSYFKSFKENFKQITAVWLIFLIVYAILAFDWYNVLFGMAMGMPFILKAALGVLTFLVWSVTYCMFPFLARYDVESKELFKASSDEGQAARFPAARRTSERRGIDVRSARGDCKSPPISVQNAGPSSDSAARANASSCPVAYSRSRAM